MSEFYMGFSIGISKLLSPFIDPFFWGIIAGVTVVLITLASTIVMISLLMSWVRTRFGRPGGGDA
jgi:hypothetical protein